MYVGEALAVRIAAQDPFTREPISPDGITVTVEFWEPGDSPRTDPTVRDSPDKGPYAASYETARDAWMLYVSTDGWVAGTWAYRATVEGGSYLNWTYGTVRLQE